MTEKDIKIEQGVCPECGNETLPYEASTPCGESIKFPYTCICGFSGAEYYNLQFAGHYDKDGVICCLEL